MANNKAFLEFIRIPVASYTEKVSQTIDDIATLYGSNFTEKIYNSTNDLASGIALKMREYGDSLAGKADPKTVTMLQQHFNLVEDLRKNKPEKYKQLVYFSFVYPTLSYDDKSKQLVKFFTEFAKE